MVWRTFALMSYFSFILEIFQISLVTQNHENFTFSLFPNSNLIQIGTQNSSKLQYKHKTINFRDEVKTYCSAFCIHLEIKPLEMFCKKRLPFDTDHQ